DQAENDVVGGGERRGHRQSQREAEEERGGVSSHDSSFRTARPNGNVAAILCLGVRRRPFLGRGRRRLGLGLGLWRGLGGARRRSCHFFVRVHREDEGLRSQKRGKVVQRQSELHQAGF